MLTVVYGPMFAGKTEYLLKVVSELEEAERQYLVIKPAIDNRYSEAAEIVSHAGGRVNCELVEESNFDQALVEITEAEAVLIDEAQFFLPGSLLEFVDECDRRGKEVIVAGLNLDYRKKPFGAMPELIERADEKVELTAKCFQEGCKEKARYTVRTVVEKGQVVVGSSEMYVASCGRHYYLLEGEG